MRDIPRTLALLLLLGVAACKGEVGPTGPAGAPGPTGPIGPSGVNGIINRVEATGTFNSTGTFVMPLPTTAVAGGRLPFVACYVSTDRRTWISVAQLPLSPDDVYCGITGADTNAPAVSLVNGTPGNFYYILAMW